jgi:hypothetical protein
MRAPIIARCDSRGHLLPLIRIEHTRRAARRSSYLRFKRHFCVLIASGSRAARRVEFGGFDSVRPVSRDGMIEMDASSI